MLSPKRLIRYIKAQIKVFRVDRGFTVHSPFAYRFITRVLRERTPYYHFRKEVRRPWERLLYRVAVHFNPQRIHCLGEDAERAREVLRLALPSAEFTSSQPDFTYCGNLDGEIPTNAPVLFARTKILPDPHYNLSFSDGHTTIALRRSGTPPQHYFVHFRQ